MGAGKGKLSAAGEAIRLSRMDPLDAAALVSEVARDLDVPVADFRREVARQRRLRETAGSASKIEAEVAAAAAVLPVDAPWTDPLPPLDRLLNDMVAQSKRFLWLPDERWHYIVALWPMHTHFVHHPTVRLTHSPRLGFRSETEAAGKSTALDVIEVWRQPRSHRPRLPAR